jgi:hypothetical protein
MELSSIISIVCKNELRENCSLTQEYFKAGDARQTPFKKRKNMVSERIEKRLCFLNAIAGGLIISAKISEK